MEGRALGFKMLSLVGLFLSLSLFFFPKGLWFFGRGFNFASFSGSWWSLLHSCGFGSQSPENTWLWLLTDTGHQG